MKNDICPTRMSFLIGWRLSQGHFLAHRNLLHQMYESLSNPFFPAQYHEGGNELTAILSGKGAIETEGDEGSRCVYPFEGGDLLFIPAGIAYRVVNRGEGELLAWVLFAEGAHSFWCDGSPAD